jgi:ACT domain-containing protein
MHKTLDRIAKQIRKEKRMDIVKFCDVLNLSPSSFYNYRKFIVSRYPDIIYENGEFQVLESENNAV